MHIKIIYIFNCFVFIFHQNLKPTHIFGCFYTGILVLNFVLLDWLCTLLQVNN